MNNEKGDGRFGHGPGEIGATLNLDRRWRRYHGRFSFLFAIGGAIFGGLFGLLLGLLLVRKHGIWQVTLTSLVGFGTGWRVEVAMPHSHIKFMVVDGKKALIAGFNMEYVHYASDHPSGLGEDKQDLGVLVSGPVVQNAHRTFDDLWAGSPLYNCSDFYPAVIPWQLTCRKGTGTADHVPEVLKYYLPGADSTIFSMYRSKEHDEADRIVESSLGAAQKRVDAIMSLKIAAYGIKLRFDSWKIICITRQP